MHKAAPICHRWLRTGKLDVPLPSLTFNWNGANQTGTLILFQKGNHLNVLSVVDAYLFPADQGGLQVHFHQSTPMLLPGLCSSHSQRSAGFTGNGTMPFPCSLSCNFQDRLNYRCFQPELKTNTTERSAPSRNDSVEYDSDQPQATHFPKIPRYSTETPVFHLLARQLRTLNLTHILSHSVSIITAAPEVLPV